MSTSNAPTSNQPDSPETEYVHPVTRGVSGKAIIVLIFLFGGILTAILYLYWTYHTARFRPLQDAIAFEFEKSMPRVEGGKKKLHQKDSPEILRVTMKVFFDPNNSPQTEQHAERLTAFIQKHVNIHAFDLLEYNFYQLNPEKKIKEKQLTFETKDIKTD